MADTADLPPAEKLRVENDYLFVDDVDGEEYVAVRRLMFHWTMLRGFYFDCGYSDNWCYATLEKVLAAREEWMARGWQGEPTGWHRNPKTGRRRPDGDASQEYIAH